MTAAVRLRKPESHAVSHAHADAFLQAILEAPDDDVPRPGRVLPRPRGAR